MAELDLDRLRAERDAARREGNNEPPGLTFGGQHFELPVELSLDLAWDLEEGNLTKREFFKVLIGEVEYEKFMTLGPTSADWDAFNDYLRQTYNPPKADAMGESPASDAS